MTADDAILVVDVGTVTTSAVLVADGDATLIKDPASGSRAWPSSVYLDDDGALLAGAQAEGRKLARPENYRAEFLRDLGQDAPVILGGQHFTPAALVTGMLRALREGTTHGHGFGFAMANRVLLTVPASYGPADPRRDLVTRAAETAGFAVVELIARPSAAVLCGEPFPAGDLVLVCDLAGATFDVAVIRIKDEGRYEPEVLVHNTIDDLGDAIPVGLTVQRGTELLRSAQLLPANLAAVLLVGRASQDPALTDALAAELKRPVHVAPDPELAVLLGAARFAARARDRLATPDQSASADRPLRWTIPGDTATFLRWLVNDGDSYRAGQPFAEVRLASGTVMNLCDSEDGVLHGRHAAEGTLVATGDWLATTRAFRTWHASVGARPVGMLAGSDDLVYVGSARGDVMALSKGTGDRRWRFKHCDDGAARVVAADATVYVSVKHGVLYALDPASGDARWHRRLTKKSTLPLAPAAGTGLVCAWAKDGVLSGVDGNDGRILWQVDIGAPRRGFLSLRDGTIYAASGTRRLRAVDAANGDKRWEFHYPAAATAAGPPLGEQGSVYLGLSTGLVALNSLTGEPRWTAPVQCATGPVVVAGLVYVGGLDGTIAAVDGETGALLRERELGAATVASLVRDETMLYAVTSDGQVCAVSPSDLTVGWRREAAGALAAPLVSDGVLYIGSSDWSVCAISTLTGNCAQEKAVRQRRRRSR